MKKTQILVGSFLLALLLGIGIYIFWNSKDTKPLSQTSLAEIQEPSSTQSGAASLSRALSLEKQIQLEQISEIYEVQESSHLTLIIESFQKYKADFSLTDAQKVHEVLQTHPSQDSLKSQLQALTGISLLKNDLEKLQNSYKNLQEEKQLEQERLGLFAEAQEREVRAANEQLLEMILRNSIETFGASESLANTNTLIKNIQESLLKPQNIFDTEVFNTHVKQKTFLKTQLEKNIFGTTLSSEQKEELRETILKNILEGEILLPSTPQTGYFWKIPGFASMQIWEFFIPHQSYASETDDITPAERAILLLKTQVQINKLLQKSIDTEIALNNGSISAVEYDSIINQNLIAIEELLIFQESLENDGTLLSLDTIQNFQLGSYVDDSQQIINLNPIAYIAGKRGHVMVQNLNGSVKLGQENMMLYPGYAIETLAGAEVTLVFIDESLLRLEALSKVSLKSGTENLAVEVNTGSIWARVLKPLLSGEVLSIDTGDVSLAVAGTSVYVSASGSTKQIFVVDSYFPEGSGSVIATQKSNGQEQTVSNGKKIELPANGNLQVRNQNKASLLQAKTQLGDYIAEDLSYISLTLDDRKRGFYNSPLGAENNGQNFIGKLEGELNASLPGVAERGYILKNTELAGQSMSTGSIYHLIKKDSLITDIKNSGNTPIQKSQKISAVIDINFQNIQTELGNQRALETLFDYNIAQDILDASSMNTQDLENLFLNFDIQTRENDAKILEAAKNKLTVRSLVSRDITLSGSIQQSGRTISIDWSSSSDILSSTGVVQNATLTRNRNVILTATLTLGKLSTSKDFYVIVTPRQLSDEEKLDKARDIIQTYLNIMTPITDQIPVGTQYTSFWYTITQVTGNSFSLAWQPDIRILNESGGIKRPSFSEGDTLNHRATGTLSIAGYSKTYSFTLPKILKDSTKTPQEKIDRIAEGAWDIILAGNATGNPLVFSKNTLLFPPAIPVVGGVTVSYESSGNRTTPTGTQKNQFKLIQSTNTGSLTLTPLLTLIEDGITYTGSLNPSSKTILVSPDQNLINQRNISNSLANLRNYFSGTTLVPHTLGNLKNLNGFLSNLETGVSIDRWQRTSGANLLTSTGYVSHPSFSSTLNTNIIAKLYLKAGSQTGALGNIQLNIEKKPETATEKLNRLADTFGTDFNVTGISGTQITGRTLNLPSSYDKTSATPGALSTQAIVSYTKSGSGTLTGTTLTVTPGVTTQTIKLTPKLTIGTESKILSEKIFTVAPSQAALAQRDINSMKGIIKQSLSGAIIQNNKIHLNQVNNFGTEILSLPNIKLTWNGSSYLSSTGAIKTPSYNDGTQNISANVKIEVKNTSYSGTLNGVNMTLNRQACTTPNIRIPDTNNGVCYELVASAEYDKAGDFKLENLKGGANPTMDQRYVKGVNCEGSNTGNCGWSSTNAIKNMYQYNATIKSNFDKSNSWMTYDNQSGIVVDNVDEDDYLSYDISSLNLGNDWAIEMSVRGEDLKRNPLSSTLQQDFHGLLSIEGEIYINNTNSKFGLLDRNSQKITYSGSINNGYQKITLTSEKLFYNGIFLGTFAKIPETAFSNSIKIGSNRYNIQQWNGIINYLRIYKRAE